MSESVIIRRVESKADFKPFFEFPWTVYKDDPNWVPPLLSMRKETLDKEKNPAWEYLEGDYFTAWKGDKIVGTIAAFVNKHHNEYNHENIAWFGFFECFDDREVADALLDTAINWGRDHGYDAIRGPQSFTAHEDVGLLVDGYTQPVMLMPYHPPYYKPLIENKGFEKVMDVYSFYYAYDPETFKADPTFARVKKLVKRITRNGDVVVRPVNRKDLKADFKLFQEIYNDAWSENWGFTPMTDRELQALIDGLSIFFDPRLSAIVELDGYPVGFMVGVPDFNAVLKPANSRPGVPEPLSLLNAVWHWKIRPKLNGFRIPLMGVRKEYRTRGLDIVMYDRFIDVLSSGDTPYKHVDCGWVLETNNDLIGTLQKANLEIYKTHRFYELPLK